ncbi:MAG: sigma-70 family RNA polymerase sigma factor [Chloroflexi bacterium]|nr:sigma-70 family RNA polymerase sigma factor [Chloroflexota bacterium]MDA1298109.1 sigma-70 family RNA polymerase sigma factor [Chloroflexota bacterium]
MTSPDEQKLIQLSLEGHLDSFNRLVEIHQDAVFSVALRMVRNHAIAEDLTQDAFISAFSNLRSYRGGIFKAWLMRIVRNATYDHLRRTKRRPETSIDQNIVSFSDTLESGERSPHEWAQSGELGEIISHCMGELSADQRMAVVLVDIEGYQYDEAAESMGVSIGTVKSRLNRARARLRDCLQAHPEHLPDSMRLGNREDQVTRANDV